MNEFEIHEAFTFELQLAQILLADEPWTHKFKELKIKPVKASKAERNGTVTLSSLQDFHELRDDIRSLLTDLHTGFIPRDKFLWQRIAKKLDLGIDKEANDLAECKLCGQLTVLNTTKRCPKCKSIEEAVLRDPESARKILATFDIARKVLTRLEPFEFTEEEKNEYGVEDD
jgi:hypothetical protein